MQVSYFVYSSSFLALMASAARKKQLRQEANAAKGKTTRKYTWNENNRYGGAPKKRSSRRKRNNKSKNNTIKIKPQSRSSVHRSHSSKKEIALSRVNNS